MPREFEATFVVRPADSTLPPCDDTSHSKDQFYGAAVLIESKDGGRGRVRIRGRRNEKTWLVDIAPSTVF